MNLPKSKIICKLLILFFICLFLNLGYTQNIEQNIILNVDYAKFKYDANKTLLEVYYYLYVNKPVVYNPEQMNINLNFQLFDYVCCTCKL